MTVGRYAELFDSQAVLHLQQLEQQLPQLEQTSATSLQARQECLRQLHSLKGMAQAMDMAPLSDTCHVLESIVTAWGQLPWSQQQLLLLQQGIDVLWEQVEAAKHNQPMSAPTALLASLQHQAQRTAQQASPLQLVPMQADGLAADATGLPSKLAEQDSGWRERQPWQIMLETLHDGLGEMLLLRQQLMSRYGAQIPTPVLRLLEQWHTQVRSLQSKVQDARLLPLHSAWQRYPRLLRDLAGKLQKQVVLHMEGAYLELDRDVLSALDGVMLHLLRNAIAHGIETPAERMAAGKPLPGRIALRAHRDGQAMLIELEDDGIGLQPELLRRTAVRKNLMTLEQATLLSDEQACSLIFRAGFSTQDELTELAGRGVGLDAVVCQLEASGGWIRVEKPNSQRGTLFVLRIPTSMATLPALLVTIEPYRLALSVTKIAGVVAATSLHTSNQGDVAIDFHGKSVPYYPLHTLLALPHPPSAISLIVLVHAGPSLLALGIGGQLSYQDLSVKSTQGPLAQLEWLTGVAILADGTPIVLLDVVHLLRMHQESRHG